METTLIFAGIPALVIVIIVGAVYTGNSGRSKRYRPGRPFEFTPVWFLAAPEEMAEAAKAREEREARELTGSTRAALPAKASAAVGQWPGVAEAAQQTTGGASDRW
jgi:hypothetical protein